MPLRSIWNAFRGRSASDCEISEPASASSEVAGKAKAEEAIPAKTTRAVSHKPTRGILSFGRGAHAALCKTIRKTGATTILEISVGDGSRAIAMVETLSKANPQAAIRYAAIDQFELAGGDISLMQFHRELRKHSIRPQIFPLEVASGIDRVACTIGAVDLVLISQPAGSDSGLSEDQWIGLLRRVTHQNSLVLREEGESWKPLVVTGGAPQSPCRAA